MPHYDFIVRANVMYITLFFDEYTNSHESLQVLCVCVSTISKNYVSLYLAFIGSFILFYQQCIMCGILICIDAFAYHSTQMYL